MSRWGRRVAGGILAAVAVVLAVPPAARAEPGVPVSPGGWSSELDGLSEADRDFVMRVRLVGMFPELSAGSLSDADRDFVIKVRLAGLRPESGEND